MIDYIRVILIILFFTAVPFATLVFEKWENKMDAKARQIKMAEQKALEEQLAREEPKD